MSGLTCESNITSTEIPTVVQAPKKNLREIVPRLVNFSNLFKICYVQSDPLPPAITFLQSLRADGLNFVKIPINDKEDRLYLESPIKRLLTICKCDIVYVEKTIDQFNKSPNTETRNRLLNLVRLVRDYCEFYDIEFLTDAV